MFYFWRERPNIDEYFELEERGIVLPNHGTISIELARFQWDAVEIAAKHTGTTISAILDSTISKLPVDFEKSLLNEMFSHGINHLIHEKAQFISLNVFKPINDNSSKDTPTKHWPLKSVSLDSFKIAEKAKQYIVNALLNYRAECLDFLIINHMKPYQDSNKRCVTIAKRIKLRPVN